MEPTGEKVVPTKEEVKELLRHCNSGAYIPMSLGKEDSEWGEGMGWGQISKSFVSSFSIYFSKGA